MNKKIGAQLYTIREYTKTIEDFDQSLKKLEEIGYKAIQLSAVGSFSGTAIKNLCEKHHMEVACTHRSLEEYREHLAESITFHKEIGCKIPGLGAYPKLWQEFTKEDVKSFIKEMNQIHAEMKTHGMSFAYHNHHYEFLKLDGKYVMDYLIEEGEFDFIVDVYWLAYAGVDPCAFISRLGKRARVIHFKDLKLIRGQNGEREQAMAEVMEGNLNWDGIIAAAEAAGSEWAMVEQDICPGDPFESLKISYENLKIKGFY